MIAWPPQLEDVRRELRRKPSDTADDVNLQIALDAAIARAMELRAGDFDFSGATGLPGVVLVDGVAVPLPEPDEKFVLGTVRLAIRWRRRADSPEGLVDMGELGSARIPSIDPDIEQQLGVGRYREPMVL